MKHFYFAMSLFIFLIACEKDKVSRSDYNEYLTTNSIFSEIDFFPVELYENYNETDTPSLKIHFITSEIYPCINFQIATTQFTKDNELIVRFDSVRKYTICLTAIGPATTYIDLPENINRLVLINGQTIDKYQIDITDEKIDISQISKNFTNLKSKKL